MRSNFLIVMRMRKRFMRQALPLIRHLLRQGYAAAQCGLARNAMSSPHRTVSNLRALKS